MSKHHKCPICGEYEFEEPYSYDICPVCGWEDDIMPEKSDFMTGANHCSYMAAKELWKHGKTMWDFDNGNYTDDDLGGINPRDDEYDSDVEISPED